MESEPIDISVYIAETGEKIIVSVLPSSRMDCVQMRLQEILGTPIHHIILLCAPDGRSVNPRASAYRLQNALDKEGGVLFVFDRRKCSANATEELVSFDWDMNNGHWESVNALSIEFGSLKLCSPLFRTVQEYECQCRLHHAMVENWLEMSKEGTALAQNCLQKAQIQLQALQVAASNLMLHVGSVVKQVDDMDCRITSLQSGLNSIEFQLATAVTKMNSITVWGTSARQTFRLADFLNEEQTMHIFEHTQQLATLLGMQMEKLLEQITDVKRSSQLVKESSPTMNTEPPLYELQQNMEVHQQTHHELEQVKSSLFQDYSMIRDFVYQIAKELEEGKSASTDVTACSRLDEMYNNHKDIMNTTRDNAEFIFNTVKSIVQAKNALTSQLLDRLKVISALQTHIQAVRLMMNSNQKQMEEIEQNVCHLELFVSLPNAFGEIDLQNDKQESRGKFLQKFGPILPPNISLSMTTPKATLIMLDPTSDVYTFCENDQLHESVFHTIVEDDSTAECNQENWQLLQHVVINSPHSIERSIASEKEQDLKESVESEQLKLSRSDTPNKLFSDNLRDLAQTNEYQEMTNMPSEVIRLTSLEQLEAANSLIIRHLESSPWNNQNDNSRMLSSGSVQSPNQGPWHQRLFHRIRASNRHNHSRCIPTCSSFLSFPCGRHQSLTQTEIELDVYEDN